MDASELKRRKELTFEQAEGAEALPTQLELREVSDTLRARLWNVIFRYLKAHKRNSWISDPAMSVLTDFYVERIGIMADEIRSDFEFNTNIIKKFFNADSEYTDIFGTTQWFVRKINAREFSYEVSRILEMERAAYRLIGGDTIVPIASPEEGEAYSLAVQQLAEKSLPGAKRHLTEAAGHLTEGQYAASVRESIHTIESILRLKDRKQTFADALKEHSALINMHGAFRTALVNLYGYASDEEGIRHSLVERGAANVTERDAIFMLGVCASFATYLTSIPEDR